MHIDMIRAQRGASMFFLAVVLLFIAIGLMATFALLQGKSQGDRSAALQDRFNTIRGALEQYAASNGNLPCGANPASATGLADPEAPSVGCPATSTAVPWRTIGIRQEDAFDPWGSKISYRVFSGGVGSLTQAGGASMVNCDTEETWPGGVTSTGLCRVGKDTTPAQFLAGKGLQINDYGSLVTDAAFVLISHGPTGMGAFTSDGIQRAAPLNVNETANLGAAGPYIARAPSTAGTAPGSIGHFDDLLSYVQLADLVDHAHLSARNWPDVPALASVTLNTATLTTALERAPGSGDLGQSVVNLQNTQLVGYVGGTSQNLSLDSIGGAEGIGGAGGGAGLSSAFSEYVRINFTLKAKKLGITLADFGGDNYIFFGFPIPYQEQVQFRFWNGTTTLGTVVKQGCRADGGLGSFTLDVEALFGAGKEFDGVDVIPWPTTIFFTGSTFTIAAFATCESGACQSPLAAAPNTCP